MLQISPCFKFSSSSCLSREPSSFQECVVAYASRTLTKVERKYCAARREMLALVWGVCQYRPYVYGQSFTVRTDHNALRWLQNFQDLEGQVARWLEVLSEYNFKVIHRPGPKHGNATPALQAVWTMHTYGSRRHRQSGTGSSSHYRREQYMVPQVVQRGNAQFAERRPRY